MTIDDSIGARPVSDTPPHLSVIICALGRPGADAAVASVLDSAAAGGIDAHVVLVWQARASPPPVPRGATILRALPAGVSYARNRGAAATAANVLAFIDDDERAAPGWAAALRAAFDEGADVAVGPIVPADDLGFPHCHRSGSQPRWYTDLSTPPWMIGSGGNFAMRRALFHKLGGFDQRMGPGSVGRAGEDTELLARALVRGARVRWNPEMIVTHPTKTAAERLASRHPYGFGAGRMVRRLRSPALATRYGVGLLWGAHEALRARSLRRARELVAAATGFVSGAATRDRWTSPERLVERIPAIIRAELQTRPLVPWRVPHRAPPHFLWAAGTDLVLHAYAGVESDWSAGIEPRRLALAAGVTGIPAVRAFASDEDVCWVLEQRLVGRHPRNRTEWWNPVAEWAESLARIVGPPLRTSAWWHHARAAVPTTPAFAAALEQLGDSRTAIVHGDLQAKNVLLDETGSVGILDWEGSRVNGLLGLDLLYLAVAAREPSARGEAVGDLAAGRDPKGTPVLARLSGVGVRAGDLPALLTAAVHVWAAAERVRRRTLGVPPQAALFEPLIAALPEPFAAHIMR